MDVLLSRLWGGVFYIFKWRKKNNDRIILKPDKADYKWICLALIIGALAKVAFDFFFRLEISAPMIYREFYNYILSGNAPAVWLGIAAFMMQYVYYIFEFILLACIVDCSQHLSIKLNWTQRIPWGGIFLTLTWGLIHPWGLLQGEFIYALRAILLCLVIGFAYLFPGKKPLYAFFAVMAWYWF